MADLDYSAYNNLPYIRDANKLFDRQLANNNLSRETFLSKLFPLFKSDPDAANFAVCLIHRHYILHEGEGMVSEGLSTRPQNLKEVPADSTVPEVWMITGSAVEHRVVDVATPPPSSELFRKFSEISGTYNVDALGICNLPPVLAVEDGYRVVEMAGVVKEREQVIRVVPIAEGGTIGDTFQAIWVPGDTAMDCVCVCRDHTPNVETSYRLQDYLL